MIGTFLKRLFWLVVLMLLQVLVFNHVQILGYATPMLCVYLILLFPLGTSRSQILLWGFATGLLQDIFTNTPGMSAASLTLVALFQPDLLKLFASKDFVENEDAPVPSARSMNWPPFLRYVFVAVLINQMAFYLLEAFSFFNPIELGINVGGGTLMSFLVMVAMEGVRKGYTKKQNP